MRSRVWQSELVLEGTADTITLQRYRLSPIGKLQRVLTDEHCQIMSRGGNAHQLLANVVGGNSASNLLAPSIMVSYRPRRSSLPAKRSRSA